MKKKPLAEKSKTSGVSMPPTLKENARLLAADRGFTGVSAFVQWLLVREIKESGISDLEHADNLRNKGKQKIAGAIKKIKDGLKKKKE